MSRLVSTLLALTTSGLSGSAGATQTVAPIQRSCTDEATAATADSVAARFDHHQFVFIGSTHGDVKIEEFLICLVSRPAFSRRVTDIVVEWASSGHQSLIDRYILGLEPLPHDSLTSIYFDSTDRRAKARARQALFHQVGSAAYDAGAVSR